MKTKITKKHEYLTGWTMYDLVIKTDFSGVRNKTLQSTSVVTKEPFSAKILKEWALEKGHDIDSLFTDIEECENDCKKMNQFIKSFNDWNCKNINELNSQNKCTVQYTATLNPNYKPLKTSFETYDAYDVEVLIEYKSGVINIVFPSIGRRKNTACQMLVFSGGKLKTVYEKEEAIEKIKANIARDIEDCDTDKKFCELKEKLVDVKSRLMKHFK